MERGKQGGVAAVVRSGGRGSKQWNNMRCGEKNCGKR